MNPERGGKTPGSPEEWMEYAKSDLRAAHLLANDDLVIPEQSCFHAQQAAEKALKAVLLSRKISFPPTHDIEELLGLAKKGGIAISDNIKDASTLTPYAVETRYPGTWGGITKDELAEAIKMAGTILEWAERQVLTK